MSETNFPRLVAPIENVVVAGTLITALPSSTTSLVKFSTDGCNQIDVIMFLTRVAATAIVVTPVKSYDGSTWALVGSSSIAAGVDTLTDYSISYAFAATKNISFSLPVAWPFTGFYFTNTAASTDTIRIDVAKSIV